MDRKKKKKQALAALGTLVTMAIVFGFLYLHFSGNLTFVRTNKDFTPLAQEEIAELDEFTVPGYFPEIRVANIVARWNQENTFFWTKGKYEVNPSTNRDSIVYSVALRVDITAANTSIAFVDEKIDTMLWGLVRTTLLGQDEQNFPSFIQILTYYWIGDTPVFDSDYSYIFPSHKFLDILGETDPSKITEYVSAKPIVPSLPNVGPLWKLPSLIPNQ